MIDYSAIGRRIRHARKNAGLTQEALAERMQVSCVYVSQIECGRTRPSLGCLDRVADALQIDIGMLLTNVNPVRREYGDSELARLTRDWPAEEKRILIELIGTINERLRYQQNEPDR